MKVKSISSTLFSIWLAIAFLLSACGPAATPTQEAAQPAATQAQPQQQQPTEQPTEQPTALSDIWENVDPSGQTVTFWHQHTREREEALLEIVDEFNKTNPYGITVVAEYQGSYGDIFNKMLTLLNTPDAPELVVAYQNQAATYQLADALVDMNSLVNSPKWGLTPEEQADFFPGFFEQDVFPNFDNARLAFPPNRSAEVMYYNIDWLKELGYTAPPQTPEEFKEMACKATQQPFSKATAQEGSIGYELSIDASRFASWAFAFGGDIYDYTNNQYTYNSEASQKAMLFLQDLFKSGCASLVTEKYGDQTDFGAGKALFTIGSSSGLPFYQTAVNEGAKFTWDVAALPHVSKDPALNVYGASVSIPKNSPEQELAAWLFLKYYTSPEVQAKWAKVSQYFPVRFSVAKELNDYFTEQPSYKTAFDLLKYAKFEPPTPGYDFVRVMVEEAMAAIANGADVASTLEKLNTDANANLSEQLAQMKK